MTYYLVMFQIPTPVPNPGPIKRAITRARYERLCELEDANIDCTEGNFSTITGTKRIFSIEADNSAFIVVDVKKNRKE
jgi:hypothetical protein